MERLKIKDITFDEELREILINGGTIIASHFGTHVFTCLVRLPKDKFYEIEDAEFGNRKFEFIQFQTSISNLENLITYHAVSRNGHVREIKRKVYKDHIENNFHAKR